MSGLLSDRSGLLKRCVGGVTRKQHRDKLEFTKIIVVLTSMLAVARKW